MSGRCFTQQVSARKEEYDMVVVNPEKLAATEFRHGSIRKRCVIYRGENGQDGDILYRNVEDYLKSLV